MNAAARVYVPASAPPHVRADVEMRLSNRFGGATTFDARGSWNDDSGRLIAEDVVVIESVAEGEDAAADEAQRAAKGVKRATDEDAVMWEVRPVLVGGFE